MAGSKKKIKTKSIPKENINPCEKPENLNALKPVWRFSKTDKEYWKNDREEVQKIFWAEIFPRLQGLETQTWNEILVNGKKQNHYINVVDLNKIAIDRFAKLHIEAESIISLRITGTHRIYGYIEDEAFNILWIDLDHGDNYTCVCRSRKKHT